MAPLHSSGGLAERVQHLESAPSRPAQHVNCRWHIEPSSERGRTCCRYVIDLQAMKNPQFHSSLVSCVPIMVQVRYVVMSSPPLFATWRESQRPT